MHQTPQTIDKLQSDDKRSMDGNDLSGSQSISKRMKAAPPPDSDEDSIEQDDLVEKRIKIIRELSELDKPPKRFTGGIVITSESNSNLHSASASLSVAEKKGKKEVEELKRELDLKNTFSNETNRRDEDAEMNRYIEEQIRLRREATKAKEKQTTDAESSNHKSELSEFFNLPSTEPTDRVDDILLHTLSKSHPATTDEKSEAMLSSQMLNGIPEVDLGMSERIRTIEATEEAKLRLVSGSSSQNRKHLNSNGAPTNYSSNFQQHRSTKYKEDHKSSGASDLAKTVIEPVVSVGEEPREMEYRLPSTGERRPPQRGKASDDYHLQKFKKNSRR